MRFTDIFIQKPVLATVVSLFILLFGVRAVFDLNVRQFPEVQNAVVTVSTAYIGADADLVQGFITTPMEREIAEAEGIDYIVSNSLPGISTVQAFLELDYDPNQALTQISAQVDKIRSDLPWRPRTRWWISPWVRMWRRCTCRSIPSASPTIRPRTT